MSRFRRAVNSVASGYLVLITTAVYGLASVPLALHYLSKERFALWALMSTISGYLMLIDLGMSSSVARLLIDHKDQREGGTYGSLIKTGWLVLITQGILVFVAGFELAPILCKVLKRIPTDLQGEFVVLLRWQAVTLGVGFATRIFGHLLQAHQRIDIANYSQIASLLLNYLLLWLLFHAEQGVFSFVWAMLLSSVCGAFMMMWACFHLRLFPASGAWGRACWQRFKEIFSYGSDMFLVAVGAQLITASQTLIITRTLGLETAAVWAIGTRMFTLISQVIWRISDVAGPAFSEMMVRGEHTLLRERYRAVLVLTASFSGVVAVSYALANSSFVTVWTHGRIWWPAGNDVLLGIWMIVMAILHCHNVFLLLTKKIGAMRYVFFVEGLVFVTTALLSAKRGGLPAIILCSILCSTVFSGAYGVWRISRYFELAVREVAFEWLVPMGRVLLLFVPLAIGSWWVSGQFNEPSVRLIAFSLLGGSAGAYLFLRFGLPQSFQRELLERSPKGINPILKRVFVSSAH